MITICYGSETGNAESLAEMTQTHFKDKGHDTELMELDAITLPELAQRSHVLILTSTWGDGDPPSNAMVFAEALEKADLQLPNLKYSVLALGDTSYPEFCKFGHDIDETLERLGASRLYRLQECDIDYEDDYRTWLDGVTQTITPATV